MGVRIDIAAARRVLREEAQSQAPVPDEWTDIVRTLSEACEARPGTPKTHIAMLGTALLAKSTEASVDVFALKVSAETPGAYSARNLAKEALAALAPSLAIDLGVSGREPLNNQPYFRAQRITPGMKEIIRGDGIRPFEIVYGALQRLDGLTQAEARDALRAFLRGRRRVPPPPLDDSPGIAVLPSVLARELRAFVDEESEGGRRAQAVAAALLDVVFGVGRVTVERVNDPDRHFPGDVGVLSEAVPHSALRVYEVRDKPVHDHDLDHFVEKAYRHGARRAGVMCMGPGQPAFDRVGAVDRAFARGVALRVYVGWEELINDVLFGGSEPPREQVRTLGLAAYERMIELEVSRKGLEGWAALVRRLSS